MKLLLDTHALLWWLSDDPSLSRKARAAIGKGTSDVFVSAVSVWEIAIKRSIGKLATPDDLLEQIERHRFESLPITPADAWTAGSLPAHHNDPFDRLLVAQALSADLTIVTRDRRLGRYGVSVLST